MDQLFPFRTLIKTTLEKKITPLSRDQSWRACKMRLVCRKCCLRSISGLENGSVYTDPIEKPGEFSMAALSVVHFLREFLILYEGVLAQGF